MTFATVLKVDVVGHHLGPKLGSPLVSQDFFSSWIIDKGLILNMHSKFGSVPIQTGSEQIKNAHFPSGSGNLSFHLPSPKYCLLKGTCTPK